MRALLVVCMFAGALTAGCQTAARYQGDTSSPYYVVPAGSRLVLNQPLSFQSDQVSLYVQNGRILRAPSVNKYYPFCKFELYRRVQAARTINPDEIIVTHAEQQWLDNTFLRLEGVHFAQLSMGLPAQFGGSEDSGPSLASFITRMDLRSDTQPDVYRMTCLRWALPKYPEYLSIDEIRGTLSPLFTLRLPDER